MNSVLQRMTTVARRLKQASADARLCIRYGERVNARTCTTRHMDTLHVMQGPAHAGRFMFVDYNAGPDVPLAGTRPVFSDHNSTQACMYERA